MFSRKSLSFKTKISRGSTTERSISTMEERNPLTDAAGSSTVRLRKETARERARRNWSRVQILMQAKKTVGRIQTDLIVNDRKPTARILRKNKPLRYLDSTKKFITTLLKWIWKLIVTFLAFYYVIVVPYRVGFSYYTTDFLIADVFIDFVTILAFVGRYYLRFQEKKASAEIAIYGYYRAVFKDFLLYQTVIQILISLPWELISRNYIGIKIIHILSVHSLNQTTIKLSIPFDQTKLFKELKAFSWFIELLLLTPIYLHLLTCMWLAVGQISIDQSWLIELDRPKKMKQLSIYVEAFSFICQTATSVGWGSVIPTTISEFFITMFFQLTTTYFILQMILAIKRVIQQLGAFETLLKQQSEEMLNWIFRIYNSNQDSNLYSKKFSENLKSFFESIKAHNSSEVFIKNQFYLDLPYFLRWDLTTYIFRENYRKFNSFFTGLSNEFIMGVLLEMSPVVIQDKDYLFPKRFECDGVYFIVGGTVGELLDNTEKMANIFHEGSVVGLKYVVMDRKPKRKHVTMSTVKAYIVPKAKFLELAKINRRDFRALQKRVVKQMVQPASKKAKERQQKRITWQEQNKQGLHRSSTALSPSTNDSRGFFQPKPLPFGKKVAPIEKLALSTLETHAPFGNTSAKDYSPHAAHARSPRRAQKQEEEKLKSELSAVALFSDGVFSPVRERVALDSFGDAFKQLKLMPISLSPNDPSTPMENNVSDNFSISAEQKQLLPLLPKRRVYVHTRFTRHLVAQDSIEFSPKNERELAPVPEFRRISKKHKTEVVHLPRTNSIPMSEKAEDDKDEVINEDESLDGISNAGNEDLDAVSDDGEAADGDNNGIGFEENEKLNSSLEVPVEGIDDNEMILDQNYFDLIGISENLKSKYERLVFVFKNIKKTAAQDTHLVQIMANNLKKYCQSKYPSKIIE